MIRFSRSMKTIRPAFGKRIKLMEVAVVVENARGEVHVTDLMLQGGRVATEWTGHPSEIRWHLSR